MELECLPLGAGREGEGVCLLLRLGSNQILLDCGLTDLSPLEGVVFDAVLCSHAHPDHAAGLPALRDRFPQVPVYASKATWQLLASSWQQNDRGKGASNSPGERSEDSQGFENGGFEDGGSEDRIRALPWRSPVELSSTLLVEMFPAGHLPGAASFLLTYTPLSDPEASRPEKKNVRHAYRIFYTGDFMLANQRLVEGLQLETLKQVRPDVLIVEGSYGTMKDLPRRDQQKHLLERIHQAIASKVSVLLPVPLLGAGQELIVLLRLHHLFTGIDLDIWTDERVAISCDAYLEILPHLPASIQNFTRHQPLFWDDRIRPRLRRLTRDRIDDLQHPCIVFTDESADISSYFASKNPWLLLLRQQPGHDAEKWTDWFTRQGSIAKISVEHYFLAEHCYFPQTLQLIHNLRPQHVVLVHGSPAYLADLTNLPELRNRYHLHAPAAGTRVELPIGETWVRTETTETAYPGELNVSDRSIAIFLSEEVAADSRWQNFSDTGLVEARWQGEKIVVRGISQRELQRRNKRDIPFETACCAACRHYRDRKCWNEASPLFGLQVASSGCCSAFEAMGGDRGF